MPKASREKCVRKGHISTLHLWWARRPLVACRAAVYGALVPADRWVKEVNLEEPAGRCREGRADPQRQEAGVESQSSGQEFVDPTLQVSGRAAVIAEAQKHILEAHAERLTAGTGRGDEDTARCLPGSRSSSSRRSGFQPDGPQNQGGECDALGVGGKRDKVTYDDIVAAPGRACSTCLPAAERFRLRPCGWAAKPTPWTSIPWPILSSFARWFIRRSTASRTRPSAA